MTITDKKRIFGYDALKALAAFFVVLYHVDHVDLGYREGQYYYPTVVQVLWLFCACGVPLFFMVNGALTVKRNYDLRHTAIKAGRLILAGIVWAVVAMGVYTLCRHDKSYFSLRMVGYYWFLFSLAAIYVINYLLGRLPQWCRWILVGALLLFPFISNLVWDWILLCKPDMLMPRWGHSGVLTMYGVVYLYAGYLFSTRQCAKWIPWVCALVGLFLLAIEATAVVNHLHKPFEGGNYCFPTLGALLLSFALFMWFKGWNPAENSWIRRSITFLGNEALGIYIFHLLLMVVVGWLFPQVEGAEFHPVVAIMIALAYMVVSAFIAALLRRSPVGFLLKL
jgi:surface polysaccharide O-acyltransferase-like enzyme